MRQIQFVVLFLLIGLNNKTLANHLLGGELGYKHISNNTYQIQLILYADCSANTAALPDLNAANPKIEIKSRAGAGFQLYQDIVLKIQQPIGQEITPLCPSEISKSSCRGGFLPGIRKYIYSANFTLPDMTATSFREWEFVFTGIQNVVNDNKAGRSYLLTNINIKSNGEPTLLMLKAYLNRSQGENSSPSFASLPTPFYCVQKNQSYNIGAIDSSIDELSYRLIPALANTGAGTVSYTNGLSGTNPLQIAGNLTFSTTNGQLYFYPNSVQNSIVVYEVTERRNGQIIGSSMREMTFVVINNCDNDAPNATLTAGQNSIADGTTLKGCAEKPISAFLNFSDPNGNNINVSYNNLPPGASINISNNNSTNPSANFIWNTPIPGVYTFYLNLEDDGCPLSVRYTQAITVEVIDIEEPTVTLLSSTNCWRKAVFRFSFPDVSSYGPYDVVIRDVNGNTVQNYTGVNGDIIDSFDIGSYTISAFSSTPSCSALPVPFSIIDSGTYDFPPDVVSPVYYCRNDVALPLTATSTSPHSPTRQNWYLDGLSTFPNPTPNTSTVGVYNYSVTETYKSCESDPKFITVYVSDPPGNSFELPSTICQYDTVLLRYTGNYRDSNGVDIQWNLGNAIVIDSGTVFGEVLITFPYNGTFSIGIDQISEYGCYGTGLLQNIYVIRSTFSRLSGDTAGCQYSPVSISNTIPLDANTSYTWEAGTDAIISANSGATASIIFNTPGEKYVKLTGENDSCSYTSYYYLTIYPKPEIDLEISQEELCLGDTAIIRVDPGVSLRFEPDIFAKQDPDSANKYYLIILKPQAFTVYSEGEGGCTDTAYVSIDNLKDCCNYFIPNAFSPNGDGTNDEFGAWFEGNPKNFKLQIFNRWGQPVFGTQNKYTSWDGTYKGKEADIDTYFYILEGECYENNLPFRESGDVTLIR